MRNFFRSRDFILIAPYAAWIGMMSFCPTTAFWYAMRAAVTSVLLVWTLLNRPSRTSQGVRHNAQGALVGFLAGLAVFAIWIAPETFFGWGASSAAATSSPYAPAVCGWPLTLVKMLASAFVISVAEELFFRVWLVAFAGFFWMVVLFAVEHGERWAVGAITGVVYGLLARRFGVLSAIVAHATTNLVLGAWVVLRGQWQFW